MSRRVAGNSGETVPSQFRLGSDVLAKLDSLVDSFAAESHDVATRSSVVRQLISREFARREKPGRPKKAKGE